MRTNHRALGQLQLPDNKEAHTHRSHHTRPRNLTVKERKAESSREFTGSSPGEKEPPSPVPAIPLAQFSG